MYIFQKTYTNITQPKEDALTAVLLLPSSPQNEMVRFAQIVESAFQQLNASKTSNPWELQVLSLTTSERSPCFNYSAIYNADIIIAECTYKKPNIFYMLGLAHATGVPVCSCYKTVDGQTVDIPFNVHGRQSLSYSLKTISLQQELKNRLQEWVVKNEQNSI